MISLSSLWLAILLSAVAVFIVSSVIHMVLTYHRNNMVAVADEESFRKAVGPMQIAPGDYMLPHCANPKEMGSEAYQQKLKEGPVMHLTVLPNGVFNMGKSLGLWFVYSLIVGVFCGYIASITLTNMSATDTIFRVVATVAFLGYGFAFIQDSIWWSRKWSTTLKFLFDALIYALITGYIFVWQWPSLL